MAQANYHQSGKQPLALHIVGENDDGTVNLAKTPNGTPILLSVPVVETAVAGHATLIKEAPTGKKTSAAEKAATEKAATEKAAAEKAAAENEAGQTANDSASK